MMFSALCLFIDATLPIVIGKSFYPPSSRCFKSTGENEGLKAITVVENSKA